MTESTPQPYLDGLVDALNGPLEDFIVYLNLHRKLTAEILCNDAGQVVESRISEDQPLKCIEYCLSCC